MDGDPTTALESYSTFKVDKIALDNIAYEKQVISCAVLEKYSKIWQGQLGEVKTHNTGFI